AFRLVPENVPPTNPPATSFSTSFVALSNAMYSSYVSWDTNGVLRLSKKSPTVTSRLVQTVEFRLSPSVMEITLSLHPIIHITPIPQTLLAVFQHQQNYRSS